MFPYTCEGEITISLVNLMSEAVYNLSATLADAQGTPLYQGITGQFAYDSGSVSLKMQEIKTGDVTIDVIFE